MKMTWRREGTRKRRTDPIGRENGETKPNGGWRRSRNTTGIKTSLADESKWIDERSKQFALSGALAGTAEHVVMYPVDTLKTRMQALGQPGQNVRTNR